MTRLLDFLLYVAEFFGYEQSIEDIERPFTRVDRKMKQRADKRAKQAADRERAARKAEQDAAARRADEELALRRRAKYAAFLAD